MPHAARSVTITPMLYAAKESAMVPMIMVIDDDPAVCDLISDILEEEGYAVATAQTAHAAQHLLNAHCPNLLIVDAQFPAIDQPPLEAVLRALPGMAQVPILWMTADLDNIPLPTDSRTPLIQKPFAIDAFVRIVAQVLRSADG